MARPRGAGDYPMTVISEVALDVLSFLDEIREVLIRHNISSRELDRLDFEADGRDVSIRTRSDPRGESYPPLAAALHTIGRTCHDQGVAVAELSCIVFLPDEITVELVAGADRRRVYRFPVEGALGAAKAEPTLLPVKASSLGTSPGQAKVA
jgi:hypothetical protein